jgi:hypothetical protein
MIVRTEQIVWREDANGTNLVTQENPDKFQVHPAFCSRRQLATLAAACLAALGLQYPEGIPCEGIAPGMAPQPESSPNSGS